MNDDLIPRISLRREDLDALHRDLPVAEVRFMIDEGDWHRLMTTAYEGMEIPVRVEGSPEEHTAVLVRACRHEKSITVVI